MRLYETRTGEIVGTQAEARAAGKGWRQIEVPTDKSGLIDHLNKNRHQRHEDCPSCGGLNTSHPEGCGRDPQTGDLNGTTLVQPKPARPTPDDGADAIGDWLYHFASSSEVHDVFMCLAARFGQSAKKDRPPEH